jgi:RNA recognition motif-containing protein
MGNGNAKLYVGNLNYAATKEELGDLFAAYGAVSDVHVLEGKGFGFVQLGTDEEAAKAMEQLNGQVFKGRALRIDVARPRQPGERPRRDYGDRGGYGERGHSPYSGRDE